MSALNPTAPYRTGHDRSCSRWARGSASTAKPSTTPAPSPSLAKVQPRRPKTPPRRTRTSRPIPQRISASQHLTTARSSTPPLWAGLPMRHSLSTRFFAPTRICRRPSAPSNSSALPKAFPSRNSPTDYTSPCHPQRPPAESRMCSASQRDVLRLLPLRHSRKQQVDILDCLPLPRVGHFKASIGSLNQRRVRVLTHRIFERRKHAKVFSIGAYRQVQRRPADRCVVEDHHDPPILERDRIEAGVILRDIDESRLRPGHAIVRRVRDGDLRSHRTRPRVQS